MKMIVLIKIMVMTMKRSLMVYTIATTTRGEVLDVDTNNDFDVVGIVDCNLI